MMFSGRDVSNRELSIHGHDLQLRDTYAGYIVISIRFPSGSKNELS